MAKDQTPHFMTPFVAGILAWVIPGAGHVFLGRTIRGVILFVCINGLFWTGVALGGVFTVNPRPVQQGGQPWWFTAQIMTGASGVASWYLQKNAYIELRHKAEKNRQSPAEALAESGLALTYPTDVVARAFSGIAGMLNTLCIFDAFMLGTMGLAGENKREEEDDQAKDQEKAA